MGEMGKGKGREEKRGRDRARKITLTKRERENLWRLGKVCICSMFSDQVLLQISDMNSFLSMFELDLIV